MNIEAMKEAERLTVLWQAAQRALEEASISGQPEFDAAYTNEQIAWDRLIDHVEFNGLNYTRFDPRGPLEDNDSETEASVAAHEVAIIQADS